MAGNLLGQPFETYVNNQIKARQKIHGKKHRSTNDLQYLNSRNAWIKLASGVALEPERLRLLGDNNLSSGISHQNLALQNVLFNGLSSFGTLNRKKIEKRAKSVGAKPEELYDFGILPTDYIYKRNQQRSGIRGSNRAYGVGGTEFGYSPMPGIIDMDFKCLNRGSIKKATVKIKAHNKSQFDVIDVLYLRLGYSVFLEWGYDKYIDNKGNLHNMGSTLIDGPFWGMEYRNSDYSKFLPEIEKMRKEYRGNYDGAFGTVSNFSWTFEDDGTYNITLEIINLGDVIESLKINLPSIVPDNADPYYAQKLATAAQNQGTAAVDENMFYNVLYPDLKEVLINFRKRSIEGNGGPPPRMGAGSTSHNNQSGTEMEETGGKEENVAERSFYSGKLSITNVFLNADGTEYKNEKVMKVDTAFEVKQAFLREALQEVHLQYVGYIQFFNKAKNRSAKLLPPVKKLKNWYEEEKLIVDLQYFPIPDKTTIQPGQDGKGEFSLNSDKNLSKLYKIEGVKGYFTYGIVTHPSKGSRWTNLRENWTEAFYKLNATQRWNMLYNNISDEGSNINFGITEKMLLSGVYKYFKDKGKASAIPETAESKALKELQKDENLKPEEKAKLEELKQKVDQQTKDYQNKNKNRIYRFFYDKREGLKTYKMDDGKIYKELSNLGKFEILENELIGTIREKIPIEVPIDTGGSYWIDNVDIVQLDVNPLDNQWFIRLGNFLAYLQNRVIPKIDTGEPMIKIDHTPDINICYTMDNVYSLNPKKCIVNNDHFIKGLDSSGDAVNDPIFPSGLNKFVNKVDDQFFYGDIMNIYFNFTRLEEIFDSVNPNNEVSLYKALKDICVDINESLGNINNIEPIVDENNFIKFIDQTTITGLENIAKHLGISEFEHKDNEVKLEIYGYNGSKSNFVRKIGITTEISKNFATAITIGATANGSVPGIEATAFSRWNIGIKDRFKNNLMDGSQKNANNSPLSGSASDQIRTKYATMIGETSNKYSRLGFDEGDNKIINTSYIDYNKGVAADFYKLKQAEQSFETDENGNPINSVESSIGFLPFNLKIDCDGISGIKIYNRVNVNTEFLPSNYPETLEFIITGVNHKLSNNDWVTSLETIATSKNTITK